MQSDRLTLRLNRGKLSEYLLDLLDLHIIVTLYEPKIASSCVTYIYHAPKAFHEHISLSYSEPCAKPGE